MKHEAETEAALYTIKRIDPGAPTYSLEFLRKHPEISTESVPWHIHSQHSESARDRNRGNSLGRGAHWFKNISIDAAFFVP